MNIKTILNPIARGEFNRKKAIEKTIKNGIRSVNKKIKENVKKVIRNSIHMIFT